MKSRSQPNQRGFTSPPKCMPQPMYVLSLVPKPSSNCSVGRTTPLKSTCPQGCGMYQANVTSGAAALVIPVGPLQGAAVGLLKVPQVPVAGDQTSVSGCSIETEKAPRKPHGASGAV